VRLHSGGEEEVEINSISSDNPDKVVKREDRSHHFQLPRVQTAFMPGTGREKCSNKNNEQQFAGEIVQNSASNQLYFSAKIAVKRLMSREKTSLLRP
jgi:hypothetical protein